MTCSHELRLGGDAFDMSTQPSGRVLVRISLPAATIELAEQALALLSCWWLRWHPAAPCAFEWRDDAWQVRCDIPPPPDPLFVSILQDLLAIKHATTSC